MITDSVYYNHRKAKKTKRNGDYKNDGCIKRRIYRFKNYSLKSDEAFRRKQFN